LNERSEEHRKLQVTIDSDVEKGFRTPVLGWVAQIQRGSKSGYS